MEEHPVLRILAVIVLVIVLMLGAWGIIVLATWMPTLWNGGGATPSQSGQTSEEPAPAPKQLSVSLSSNPLTDGVPFTLAWTHRGESGVAYGYTVSYSCGALKDVGISAPLPTGSYKTVPCNTPFNYTNATAQMTLVPHITSASAAEGASVQFTVSAVDLASGTTTAESAAIASILPSKPASQTPPPAQTTSPSVPSQPAGVPDLAVQILSVTPTSAEFKISNIGSATAPAGWRFSAELPTNGGYAYSSPAQQAIHPGGFILNTLNWTNPGTCPSYSYSYQYPSACTNYPSAGVFSVTVDSAGAVPDLNRSNNYAHAAI